MGLGSWVFGLWSSRIKSKAKDPRPNFEIKPKAQGQKPKPKVKEFMLKKLLNYLKPNPVSEPLVLRNEIWKAVFSDLKAIGNGEFNLPSNQIVVSIFAPGSEERSLLSSAFGNGRLESFLSQKLVEERCPQTVGVTLNFVDEPGKSWKNEQVFKLNYGGRAALQVPAVIIKILKGKASKKRYTFTRETINIGRSAEALDNYGTLVRKNDVDFEDIAEEPNNYVSKIHAQIQYKASENAFYLSDSGFEHGLTTNGTRLFRQGNLVAKLNADQKIAIQSGDEIHLGKAAIEFEITS